MNPKEIIDEIQKRIKEETEKPLKVSIMGQTGVGKSSLLNALFGTALKTDAVKPCTKEIEKVIVKGEENSELWFYDLPGIGESIDADSGYIKKYVEMIVESDVVLWAMHTDNRSTAFDVAALWGLIETFSEEDRYKIMSKITFVLTKADVLAQPSWILGKINNQIADFTPSVEVNQILEFKKEFYQETFITPYLKYIVSETYNDCDFKISDDDFVVNKNLVKYNGYLSSEKLNNLIGRYPNYETVFHRLYRNYEVVACSSQFRYNLNQLMVVITNKLGENAIRRFKKFTESSNLSTVKISEAKKCCNLIVFDTMSGKTIFNLNNLNI